MNFFIPRTISIHALREEGDVAAEVEAQHEMISIHALREEGDDGDLLHGSTFHNFYPRPPRGGRRCGQRAGLAGLQISIHALREEGDTPSNTVSVRPSDFYPRPPRGGRHGKPRPWRKHHLISIHALREEGDRGGGLYPPIMGYFYPRPPRGGRRRADSLHEAVHEFLSTPSARRATANLRENRVSLEISIHALREEGDTPSTLRASRLS